MDLSLYDRIYERFCVNEATGCWEWQGTLTSNGYAEITYQGKTDLAHRKMYELRWGPIAAKQHVHHTCYNTRCICPMHLRAVSARANIALRHDFVTQRDDRLARFVAEHSGDVLYPGLVFESTYLASLWQCRSDTIPELLETIAFLDAHFHYEIIRHGKHGPKPSLFRLWLETALLEELSSLTDVVFSMERNSY